MAILLILANLELFEYDTYLSYLPMSHVYEMIMTLGCMAFGAKIGFYGGDTVKIIIYFLF